MDEADVRGEVYRTLRELGYWPITQTDAYAPFDIAGAKRLMAAITKQVSPNTRGMVHALSALIDKAQFKPPLGRPDILVLDPLGPSQVIEVKTLNLAQVKAFAFSRIETNQRRWLDSWQSAGGQGYLALGVIGIDKRPLWIVPWPVWKTTEELITPYQQSIPFSAGKGYRTELQAGLDLLRLMGDYLCQKQGNHWTLPDGHALHRSTPG
jgi:hypothetical protein